MKTLLIVSPGPDEPEKIICVASLVELLRSVNGQLFIHFKYNLKPLESFVASNRLIQVDLTPDFLSSAKFAHIIIDDIVWLNKATKLLLNSSSIVSMVYYGSCFKDRFIYNCKIDRVYHFCRKDLASFPERVLDKSVYISRLSVAPSFFEYRAGGDIVYCISESDCDLSISRTMIHFFNTKPGYTFAILGKKHQITLLKNEANSNIRILDKKNVQYPIPAGIVIADGLMAKTVLLHGLPLLVVGCFGYGGLCTKENHIYMEKYDFTGRPGGYFGEYIPHELLNYELMRVITLGGSMRENAIQLRESVQAQAVECDKSLKSDTVEYPYRFKLHSDIKFVQLKSDEWLVMRNNHKVIFTVTNEVKQLIDNTVLVLPAFESMSNEDMLDLIQSLIDSEVIYEIKRTV